MELKRASRWVLAAALALGGTGARAAPPDVSFQLPDGLEAKLWAETPQLHNPTNIDVDARGRIWVTEGVNYRIKDRSSKPGDGFLRHEKGDRVVILEDTDGDGVADSSKVFVEDPELVVPLGIAVIGNRVFVSCSPSVFVYTDTDGDDRADKKEVFLTGFRGHDRDHGLHSFTFGPDGRLYFSIGNPGADLVRDRSGWALRRAPQPSDDGRRWVQGLALRINLDGTGLRVLAHNFRNNYELALDAFGNLWQNDNDDDGYASCRMTYVMENGNYGYMSANGQRSWSVDRRVGQDSPTAHWHQEDPGVVPTTIVTGAGGPTGIVIYEGQLLGPRFRGMVLNADAGRSTIFGHTPKTAGATVVADETVFMASRGELGDEARRFRPSDVAVGVDGAVFVADWYDPMVGGWALQDKRAYGRIFRIAPRGNKPQVPKIDAGSPEGAIEALLSPAVNVRVLGWQALQKLGRAGRATARKRLAVEKDPRTRARLLWFVAQTGQEGKAVLAAALGDKDPDLRVVAYRALRQNDPGFVAEAQRLARDPAPAVRREVALSLRDVPVEQSRKILLDLAAAHDGHDRTYLEAVGIGFDGKEEALYHALLARLGARDPLKWPKSAIDLVWRLHPDASIPALKARAAAAALATPERQRALVAIASQPTRVAAEEMIGLTESLEEPLRSYALHLAHARASQEWRDFGVSERIRFKTGSQLKPEELARLDALKGTLGRASSDAAARTKAARDLAGTKEGGLFLIAMAAEGKVAPGLKEAVAEVIFRNPEPSVRALASQYFKRPSFEGAEIPPVAALLGMKGNAARGREMFFGDRAACHRCHEYAGKGAAIGPALTQISGKLGREAILDSVLNPSAAIAFGYEPWVITTKDQQTYSGFIVGEGASLLLKELSGETRLIPTRDIATRHQEKASIMPDNIALAMKPQELMDLVEFLATPAAQAR